MRASHPTLLTVGRAMADHRDAVIQEWTSWLDARVASAGRMPPGTIERELRLLYNIMTESVGPLEELQYLRELLIRRIGPVLTPLRQRQAMAIILRLNTILDKGIAVAVVGYTDALVATLFTQNGVPAPDSALDQHDIQKQL